MNTNLHDGIILSVTGSCLGDRPGVNSRILLKVCVNWPFWLIRLVLPDSIRVVHSSQSSVLTQYPYQYLPPYIYTDHSAAFTMPMYITCAGATTEVIWILIPVHV